MQVTLKEDRKVLRNKAALLAEKKLLMAAPTSFFDVTAKVQALVGQVRRTPHTAHTMHAKHLNQLASYRADHALTCVPRPPLGCSFPPFACAERAG